jgi:hypothetical protein
MRGGPDQSRSSEAGRTVQFGLILQQNARWDKVQLELSFGSTSAVHILVSFESATTMAVKGVNHFLFSVGLDSAQQAVSPLVVLPSSPFARRSMESSMDEKLGRGFAYVS